MDYMEKSKQESELLNLYTEMGLSEEAAYIFVKEELE